MLASDYSKPYGLVKAWYPRSKQWAVDQDYIDKLSPSDAKWLDRFNREYHAASISKFDPKALHSTDELRRDCYNRNNKSNRDLYTQSYNYNLLSLNEVVILSDSFCEDSILKRVDQKKALSSDYGKYAIRFAASYLFALDCLKRFL